ncbi:MAG TPA: MgtC/SapB family protein [Anaerolineales bacterium]|jgi:putative Mg2+ transporter-C (MgtC) family protein
MNLVYPDLTEALVKLLLAVLIGGLIGMERELHAKAAGLRTITLITVGATLFTMLSLNFQDDRVIANIVTGVGFLGAGSILFSEGRVKGLTTASSIWVSAALGMAVGLGEYWLAAISAVIVLIILWIFAQVDRMVDVLGREFRVYDITYIASEHKLEKIEAAMSDCKLHIIRRRRMKLGGNLLQGVWELSGALAQQTKFSDIILADPDVVEFKY